MSYDLRADDRRPHLNYSEVRDDTDRGGVMLVAVFFMVIGGYLTCIGVFMLGGNVRWWEMPILFLFGAILGSAYFYSFRYLLKALRAWRGEICLQKAAGAARTRILAQVCCFSNQHLFSRCGYRGVVIFGLFSVMAAGTIYIVIESFSQFLYFQQGPTIALSAIIIAVVAVCFMSAFALFVVGFDGGETIVEPRVDEPNSRGKISCVEIGIADSQVLDGGDMNKSRTVQWMQFNGSMLADTEPRVCCIGSTNPSARMCSLGPQIKWACDNSVDLCNDLVSALGAVKISPSAWKLIIVDVDHAERNIGLVKVVKQLLAFRADCPSVAVILLSHSFASNDSSSYRSCIADYSFRASVSDQFVIATLPDVFRNHQIWQERSKEPFVLWDNVLLGSSLLSNT